MSERTPDKKWQSSASSTSEEDKPNPVMEKRPANPFPIHMPREEAEMEVLAISSTNSEMSDSDESASTDHPDEIAATIPNVVMPMAVARPGTTRACQTLTPAETLTTPTRRHRTSDPKPIRTRPQVACPHCARMVVNLPRHVKILHGKRKYDILMYTQKTKKVGPPGKDKLTCGECGLRFTRLDRHLTRVHRIEKTSRKHRGLMTRAKEAKRKIEEVPSTSGFQPKATSRGSPEKGPTLPPPSSESEDETIRVIVPKRQIPPPRTPVIEESSSEEASDFEDTVSSSDIATSDPAESDPPMPTGRKASLEPPAYPPPAARDLMARFTKYMLSMDGGSLSENTAISFTNQAKYVWGHVDPDYATESLNVNSVKAVIEKMRTMVQGKTLRNYILAIKKFIGFLGLLDLAHPDEVSKMTTSAENWSKAQRKTIKRRRVETFHRDQARLLTPEMVNEMENSPEAIRATELLLKLTEDCELPCVSDIKLMQSFIMVKVFTQSAARTGVILNMTIEEFENRQRHEVSTVVSVLKHKTSAFGPANVPLSVECERFMFSFYKFVRQRLPHAEPADTFFVNVATGLPMVHGTVSKYISGSFPQLKGFTPTLMRKTMRTVIGSSNPELRAPLATAMAHTTKTADEWYNLQDRAEVTAYMGEKMVKAFSVGKAPKSRANVDLYQKRRPMPAGIVSKLTKAFKAQIESGVCPKEREVIPVLKVAGCLDILQEYSQKKVVDKIRTLIKQKQDD